MGLPWKQQQLPKLHPLMPQTAPHVDSGGTISLPMTTSRQPVVHSPGPSSFRLNYHGDVSDSGRQSKQKDELSLIMPVSPIPRAGLPCTSSKQASLSESPDPHLTSSPAAFPGAETS